MLIALWMFLTNSFLPECGGILAASIDAVMPIIVMLVIISIVLSIVGMKCDFGGPICQAILKMLGYLGKTLISAIGWCLKHLIMFIPTFFSGVRKSCLKSGMSEGKAILFSVIVTLLLIAVII